MAWRTEQPDAVMGSGPVVASRCQRLAKGALRADYHLVPQESGRAPGRFSPSWRYPWEVGAPVDSVTVSALAHRSKRNRQVPG